MKMVEFFDILKKNYSTYSTIQLAIIAYFHVFTLSQIVAVLS